MTKTPTFTCPGCGRVSHHPLDAAESYCSACKRFWDKRGQELERLRQAVESWAHLRGDGTRPAFGKSDLWDTEH